MPEVRPGQVFYAVATKIVKHGDPCTELGFVGTAIKQQAAPAGTGLGDDLITHVQIGEAFLIQIKGRVYVANVDAVGPSTFAKGAKVYIDATDNTLTSDDTKLKYGRVSEINPERGVAAGKMAVDLDAKDTL